MKSLSFIKKGGHAGHDQCQKHHCQPSHPHLGRVTQNAGWPYFDGTNRDYPAFKRKFASFQANYHYSTPTRELVQQFRDMCLPKKIAARIKSAETMEIRTYRACLQSRTGTMSTWWTTTWCCSRTSRRLALRTCWACCWFQLTRRWWCVRSLPEKSGSRERLRDGCLQLTGPGPWQHSWMSGWSTPSTWLLLASGRCYPSRFLSTGHRDRHPKRAEEAGTTTEVPLIGMPGSWSPQGIRARTGRRCTSHLRRPGILRRSGPRSVWCFKSAARSTLWQGVTPSRSCLRSRGWRQ